MLRVLASFLPSDVPFTLCFFIIYLYMLQTSTMCLYFDKMNALYISNATCLGTLPLVLSVHNKGLTFWSIVVK